MTACELRGVGVRAPGTAAPLLDGLDLVVERGEAVALVGRSGAGKSVTIRTLLELHPPGWDVRGHIAVGGDPAPAGASAQERRAVRLDRLAVVLQDPRAAFNPLRTIGDFATEAARERGDEPWAARAQAAVLLDEVGLPATVLEQYPHELSGGMLQRVAIAAALSGSPDLVIADEPTASLDVLTQAEVIATLVRAQDRHGFGLLFVTHDLALAGAVADRVVVLSGGRIVDEVRGEVLHAARGRELRALLDASAVSPGRSRVAGSATAPSAPILVVDRVTRRFGAATALDQVSLSVAEGATLALVGGSGSGKSTLARLVTGLDQPDDGSITFDRPARSRRDRAHLVQMVFQDPALSLDPRLTAHAAVARALGAAGVARGLQAERATELLTLVGLDEAAVGRRPRNLSGGQCQRVSIARALAFGARLLVLDEATSALDPETRAQVLTLLEDLRDRLGLSLLLITHDLGTVARLADEVVVLQRGRVVESGPADEVITSPRAEYTRLLIDALPHRGWRPEDLARRRRALELGTGDVVGGGGAERAARQLQRA